MQRPQGRPESLLPREVAPERSRALGRDLARERAEVEGHTECGETSLINGRVGARHAGAVAGRRDAFDARPEPLVTDDDRAAEILVVVDRAAREAEQLGRGVEAVSVA